MEKEPNKEIAQIGPVWGGLAVGIMAAFLSTVISNDKGVISLCAGILSGVFAFYVMRVNQVEADTMSPPAMPYKLSAEDVLVCVKKELSSKYFRQQKWLLDDPDPDEMELKYTYKSIEGGNPAQPEKKERLVCLIVKVAPVGNTGASLELSYYLAGGVSGDFYDKNAVPSPDVQSVCKETTRFINDKLKLSEATAAQGG